MDDGDEHRDRPTAADLASPAGLRDEVERLRALVACFPAGYLEEVAAVLVEGGKVKGCAASESGGGQTIVDHVAHAYNHVGALVSDIGDDRPISVEDITHAGARCALAWATRGER